MARQPFDVLSVALPGFLDDSARELIERFFEETSVHVFASHHVAQPEHEEQIAVHSAALRVAQIGAGARRAVAGRQSAFFSERGRGGETLTSLDHSIE
jgi:hypothetical protein